MVERKKEKLVTDTATALTLSDIQARAMLFAAMYRPNDTNYVKYISDSAASEALSNLIDQGGIQSGLFEDAAANFEKGSPHGSIAGEILLNLIGLGYAAKNGDRGLKKKPSLNIAMHVYESFAGSNQAQNSGKEVAGSRKTLFNSWRDFKNSAHLWAAYKTAKKNGMDGENLIANVVEGSELLIAQAEETSIVIANWRPVRLNISLEHQPSRILGLDRVRLSEKGIEYANEYEAEKRTAKQRDKRRRPETKRKKKERMEKRKNRLASANET